jgi:hypothetical protein
LTCDDAPHDQDGQRADLRQRAHVRKTVLGGPEAGAPQAALPRRDGLDLQLNNDQKRGIAPDVGSHIDVDIDVDISWYSG